jgi:hypothetical protein
MNGSVTSLARTLALTTLCWILAATLVGCCASSHEWAATERELRKENSTRAEPAMRAAAQRFDATLLSVKLSELPNQGVCESVVVPEIEPDKGCALWQAEAPLARRGGSLLLLIPEVSRQKVGEATSRLEPRN